MHTPTDGQRISVIGTGYVGLVTAACLAAKGHLVLCVDTIEEKVAQVNAGISPIFEPGLDELLQAHTPSRIQATTDLAAAVAATDVSFIAVGTPFDGDEIDLSQVAAASAQIGRALRDKSSYHVVVVKSTVVPGTTDDLVTPILERESGKIAGVGFGVAMNPEFLRQGEAIEDFMVPDRVVIGTNDARTAGILTELYRPFDSVVLPTTTKTAEMIKYTSNSLLATLISFSNEIGNLCGALTDVDVVDVMQGVHLDKRFSPMLAGGERVMPGMLSYLKAGCGFGGSCFPKDVKALVAYGTRAKVPMDMLRAVLDLNARQPYRAIELLGKHFADLKGVRIAVLGLAFKPNTDDMREAPSIPIVRRLLEEGAVISAYDPVAATVARRILGDGLRYCDTVAEAIAGVDAVLVLTPWPELADIPALIAAMPTPPVLIDGRRIFARNKFSRYEGIGLNHLDGRAARADLAVAESLAR